MAASAECSISRCSHERRSFRKELQKWGRNVLLLVGLERIAEEVTGRRKWKRLMEPLNQIDSNLSADWTPDELCFFCNSRKQPPLDPASGVIALESINRVNGDENETGKTKGEQPLDLSLASNALFANGIIPTVISDNIDGEDDDDLIKVPQVPAKGNVKRSSVGICSNLAKRSYTEEELQAALRDIQSGKLGTRRAAVIYGIPRSTLRNKVYKLTNGRGRSRQAYINRSSIYTAPGIRVKDENQSVEILSQPRKYLGEDQRQRNGQSASESLRQLLRHRMAERATKIKVENDDEDNVLEENGEEEDVDDDLKCSQGIAPLISQVFANIHNIALSSHKNNNHSNLELDPTQGYNSEFPLIPLIPDLIHRLAEERIMIEKERLKIKATCNSNDFSDIIATRDPAPTSSVILKIPSYKPSSKSNESSSSSHNDSVAKDSSSLSDTLDDDDEELPLKRCKMYGGNDSSSSEASNDKRGHSSSAKQKRPKRGRYRNYNRDSLLEAVRAVQRGEMSVHRAGSFYGVPHSTLEYKVKERHLLRPRKREKPIPIQPNVKKEIKLERNEDSSDSKQNGVAEKSGSSLSLFAPIDFNQLAAANQFFASQMMRKLQENAIMNAEDDKDCRQPNELLGNLIKNSLEKVCPTSSVTTNSSLIATKTDAN